MRIVEEPIARGELAKCENVHLGPMVKAVVDVRREIIGIDAVMHADIEQLLLDDGSRQDDLWGINLRFEEESLIEYDSMINIRPRQNNPSRDVEDPAVQQQIKGVVEKWIK